MATRAVVVTHSREKATEVLLEADAGFFCNAGGIRIDGLEKALYFSLNLLIAR
jgi:hypothetical protein